MHNSLFTLIRFLHIRFMQHIITLTNPDEIVIQRDRFAIYFFSGDWPGRILKRSSIPAGKEIAVYSNKGT